MTNERKNLVNFLNPIHSAGTVLSVSVDRKKHSVSMNILDSKYKPKSNNTAEIKVKILDKIKTSNCIFPNMYNDTILINCTISDINDIDPYSEGIEFLNTSDKLRIIYYNLELNNFFQTNTKISGHNNIIKEMIKKILFVIHLKIIVIMIIITMVIMIIMVIILIKISIILILILFPIGKILGDYLLEELLKLQYLVLFYY